MVISVSKSSKLIDDRVLQVFVDLGSSVSKVFYLHDDHIEILLMTPETAIVTQSRLDEFLCINPTASPDAAAWVRLPDQDIVTVGALAANFKGDAALTQRKSQPGLYRVLAVIGILREILNLPNSFSCNLGLALPVNEYRDRQKLEAALTANHSFICRGTKLNVNFSLIDTQPEGLGLIRDRYAQLKKQSVTPGRIVSLMFGHRNLSVLVFEGGSLALDACRSDGPGFVSAVEIAAKSLALEPDTEGLMEAIASNSGKLRVQGSLKPLDIEPAVREGRFGYWQQVKAYLESHLPGGKYDLVVAGGSAWAMQAELQELFQESDLNVSFSESLQQRLNESFQFRSEFQGDLTQARDDRKNSLLLMQLADSYIGFQTLLAKSKRKAVAV